jgi:hypothetical protein
VGSSARLPGRGLSNWPGWDHVERDHSKCTLIADYKMKIEPSQNREGTNEWYGKRGISYHGCAVIFMEMNGDGDGEYVRTPPRPQSCRSVIPEIDPVLQDECHNFRPPATLRQACTRNLVKISTGDRVYSQES